MFLGWEMFICESECTESSPHDDRQHVRSVSGGITQAKCMKDTRMNGTAYYARLNTRALRDVRPSNR